MTDRIMAETVRLFGNGGDVIEGYFARPLGCGPYPSVIVIHHMPGLDIGTKEIVRRFATEGYTAIAPNLYFREAPGATPDDASALVRSLGGVPGDRLVGDVKACADYLKLQPSSNSKVGVIGYCSGGRAAFLSACSLDLDAAVDCYGGFVVGDPPEGIPAAIVPIVHLTPQLSCPLLGLFGEDDVYPSPAQVEELREALIKHNKAHEFHSYPGAGHAFFAVNRPSYRPEVVVDAWEKVFDFFTRYLGN